MCVSMFMNKKKNITSSYNHRFHWTYWRSHYRKIITKEGINCVCLGSKRLSRSLNSPLPIHNVIKEQRHQYIPIDFANPLPFKDLKEKKYSGIGILQRYS